MRIFGGASDDALKRLSFQAKGNAMSSRDFFCLFLTLFLFMGPKPSWSKEKPEKEGAPCPSGCRERPRVCFSPEEDCTGWITQEIDKAQKSVQVQAFSFTSLPIA